MCFIRSLLLCAAVSYVFTLPSTALSASSFVVDQQNLVGTYSGGASSPDFVLGQSFTPALPGIDAIDLNISTLSFPSSMRIDLLDGLVGIDGLQGPVIGTTQTITITQTFKSTFRFLFANTVPVTPGNTYVMRFEPIGPNSNPQIQIHSDEGISPYPLGQALQRHLTPASIASRDFVFTEGVFGIPEPGCLLMAGLALLSLVAISGRA